MSSSSERGRKDLQVAPTDPVHVLVVDDDRNVQRMLADALGKAGFRVTVERDGEAALAAFERQPFDVVLLDVLLPALNGYEVARRIKSTPRGERTPVLMLSGIYKTKMHQAQAVERHRASGIRREAFQAEPPVREARGGARQSVPQTAPRPFVERVAGALVRAPGRPAGTGRGFPGRVYRRGVDGRRGRARRARARQAPADRRTRAGPGDVRHPRLSQLLADLHRLRATGGLLLRRDKVKKIVSCP